MNCLEFRRAKLADPGLDNADLEAHRLDCISCRQFEDELRNLDDGVREAFAVPVPENLEARVLLRQSFADQPGVGLRHKYWLAVAASMVVAVLGSLLVILPDSGSSIENQITSHVGFEERIAREIESYLPASEVQSVLDATGIKAPLELTEVVYAHKCVVANKPIAHLVMREDAGDFTVILMPFGVEEARPFSIDGWDGHIQATSFGGIAVLSERVQSTDRMQHLSDRVLASLRATGD